MWGRKAVEPWLASCRNVGATIGRPSGVQCTPLRTDLGMQFIVCHPERSRGICPFRVVSSHSMAKEQQVLSAKRPPLTRGLSSDSETGGEKTTPQSALRLTAPLTRGAIGAMRNFISPSGGYPVQRTAGLRTRRQGGSTAPRRSARGWHSATGWWRAVRSSSPSGGY